MVAKAALDRLRSVEAGMISDCMMRLGIAGWMDGVRPVQPGLRRAVGPARTLLFGPRRGEGQWTRSMYRTIASLTAGEVLVFATGGTIENLMGDNMATWADMHGIAACVTDSTVRDSAGMADLAMPVYARGTAVRLPLNMEPVAMDVPVSCGGAQVRPGDIVVGCEDGVIVVPESRVDDVLYQLEDVEVCERDLSAAIKRRASLDEIEAVLKRKKALRPR
ncbi:MAG: RraA family protein [Burkholderiales bacterium]